MLKRVEIEGNWFTGYYVVTYVNGREAARIGKFTTKREAQETRDLNTICDADR